MITDRMLAAEVMIVKRLQAGWRTRHKQGGWNTMERAAESMKLAGFAQALQAIREARKRKETS